MTNEIKAKELCITWVERAVAEPVPTIGIGSTVWRFDENRRVYPKDSGIGASPIWREHWRPVKIVGETSGSWVAQNDGKINKKAPGQKWAFSQAEIDEREWVEVHRHQIREHILQVTDPAVLRQIAALVGYEAKEKANV